MRLDVSEFMRRFLLHVLPNGFHRIRHYGLFANTHRADKLALCRSLLDVPSAPTDRHDDDSGPSGSNHELPPCPCCGGRMITIEVFDGPLSDRKSTRLNSSHSQISYAAFSLKKHRREHRAAHGGSEHADVARAHELRRQPEALAHDRQHRLAVDRHPTRLGPDAEGRARGDGD